MTYTDVFASEIANQTMNPRNKSHPCPCTCHRCDTVSIIFGTGLLITFLIVYVTENPRNKNLNGKTCSRIGVRFKTAWFNTIKWCHARILACDLIQKRWYFLSFCYSIVVRNKENGVRRFKSLLVCPFSLRQTGPSGVKLFFKLSSSQGSSALCSCWHSKYVGRRRWRRFRC